MKLNNSKTYVDKAQDINHNWYICDAQLLPLGRLATEVAKLLMGKQKPTYTPHMDNGDWVIVINAQAVALTGKKDQDKIYYRYSGYRGGLKQRTASQQRQLDARALVYKAVKGMLPKNKLQDLRLKRLKIYNDSDHPHGGQNPVKLDLQLIKRKESDGKLK